MGIRIGIGSLKIGTYNFSWSHYWTKQSNFYELWKVSGSGTMVGLKRGDILTITGSGLNAIYAVPDTAAYIAIDTDFVFHKSDGSVSTACDGNRLIGYDFPRVIVKYLDISPYTIEYIGILDTGQSVNNRMRDDFHLNPWWDGNWSDHGGIKENRAFEQNPWVAESVYCAETFALIARMTGTPSVALKDLIEKTIVDLKAGGGVIKYWDRIDVICFLGLDVVANALNWKANNYNPSPQASPTFTAKYGITLNGTTQYIKTGFKTKTNGVKFIQNNAAFVIEKDITSTKTSYASHGTYEAGTGFFLIPDTTGLNPYIRVNEGGSGINIEVRINGFRCCNRTGANLSNMWDELVRRNLNLASTSPLSDLEFYIGTTNGYNNPADGRVRFYSFTASFSNNADWEGYRTIIKYFLDNVGGTF